MTNNGTATITCNAITLKRIYEALTEAHIIASCDAMRARETEVNGRDAWTESREFWRDEIGECRSLTFDMLCDVAFQPQFTKEDRVALGF